MSSTRSTIDNLLKTGGYSSCSYASSVDRDFTVLFQAAIVRSRLLLRKKRMYLPHPSNFDVSL